MQIWRFQRRFTVWLLARLGLWVCSECGVVTPMCGNNYEDGSMVCMRCANPGIVLNDIRRAQTLEEQGSVTISNALPQMYTTTPASVTLVIGRHQ